MAKHDFADVAESYVSLFEFFSVDYQAFWESIPQSHPTHKQPTRIDTDGNVRIKLQFMQLVQMCVDQFGHPFNNCFYVLGVAFERAKENQAFLAFYDDSQGTIILSVRSIAEIKNRYSLGGLLFGHRYFVSKVKNSMPEIHITNSLGDVYTGSSFIYETESGAPSLFTCKHNLVDEGSGRFYNKVEVWMGDHQLIVNYVIVFARIDCCIIGLADSRECESLFVQSYVEVLDRVISAGYPRINMLSSSPMLFIEGSVAGLTNDADEYDRCLVLTCQIAPGHSGGPLLNNYGAVVGMTHRNVETQSIDGMAKYGLAIPISTIDALLDDKENEVFSLSSDTVGGQQIWRRLLK